jgi:hypothetical protein
MLRPIVSRGQAFTPSLFATLGVRPAMGALFAETTNPYSKDALVVVISHRLWQGHFGGAGDAIGRTMTVDGARRVIAASCRPASATRTTTSSCGSR